MPSRGLRGRRDDPHRLRESLHGDSRAHRVAARHPRVKVRCTALEADIHSGLWGGMVPDVSLALMQLVSRLVDEDGRVRAPRATVPESWKAAAWDVPLTPEVIREGGHLCHGWSPAQPRLSARRAPLASARGHGGGHHAAHVGGEEERVAPVGGGDPVGARGARHGGRGGQGGVQRRAPAGCARRRAGGGGVDDAGPGAWLYTPRGVAFEAADRAYIRAWGRPLLQVGVGEASPSWIFSGAGSATCRSSSTA